ncbi:hypothetical protein B0H10DRAFT_2437758 [Mycena sp. CBHHK59/15]|nr:hypothetical protein B0H10DRAFT_2437758 [Mycena sp. CBHHK59/15]
MSPTFKQDQHEPGKFLFKIFNITAQHCWTNWRDQGQRDCSLLWKSSQCDGEGLEPQQVLQPGHTLPAELLILILEDSTKPRPPSSCDTSTPPKFFPPFFELPSSFLSPGLDPCLLRPATPTLLQDDAPQMQPRPRLQKMEYAQSVIYSFVWLSCSAQAKRAGELLVALLQGEGLRRLSWTSYEVPVLAGFMGGRLVRRSEENTLNLNRTELSHHYGRLEYLEVTFVSSSAEHVQTADCAPVPVPDRGELVLPELRTLKLTLDNTVFA